MLTAGTDRCAAKPLNGTAAAVGAIDAVDDASDLEFDGRRRAEEAVR